MENKLKKEKLIDNKRNGQKPSKSNGSFSPSYSTIVELQAFPQKSQRKQKEEKKKKKRKERREKGENLGFF